MDGCNMEPCYWLHEDQPWVRSLLRRDHGEAIEGNGAASVSQWFQSNAAARRSRGAVTVETAEVHFCELDERSVS